MVEILKHESCSSEPCSPGCSTLYEYLCFCVTNYERIIRTKDCIAAIEKARSKILQILRNHPEHSEEGRPERPKRKKKRRPLQIVTTITRRGQKNKNDKGHKESDFQSSPDISERYKKKHEIGKQNETNLPGPSKKHDDNQIKRTDDFRSHAPQGKHDKGEKSDKRDQVEPTDNLDDRASQKPVDDLSTSSQKDQANLSVAEKVSFFNRIINKNKDKQEKQKKDKSLKAKKSLSRKDSIRRSFSRKDSMKKHRKAIESAKDVNYVTYDTEPKVRHPTNFVNPMYRPDSSSSEDEREDENNNKAKQKQRIYQNISLEDYTTYSSMDDSTSETVTRHKYKAGTIPRCSHHDQVKICISLEDCSDLPSSPEFRAYRRPFTGRRRNISAGSLERLDSTEEVKARTRLNTTATIQDTEHSQRNRRSKRTSPFLSRMDSLHFCKNCKKLTRDLKELEHSNSPIPIREIPEEFSNLCSLEWIDAGTRRTINNLITGTSLEYLMDSIFNDKLKRHLVGKRMKCENTQVTWNRRVIDANLGLPCKDFNSFQDTVETYMLNRFTTKDWIVKLRETKTRECLLAANHLIEIYDHMKNAVSRSDSNISLDDIIVDLHKLAMDNS